MWRIPPRSPDTTEEAERVQIELLRKAPIARRLHIAWTLSATVISIARRALARAHPDATEDELDIRFTEIHHGRELAAALRDDLARRRRPPSL